jgi:phosphodiesterase/alkaline phosphatase D-like protein
MTSHDIEIDFELSRRKLLAAAGIGGVAVAAASLIGPAGAEVTHLSSQSSDPVATPPVAGLHLQFGADAASEVVASWHTLQPVHNPRVVLGQLDGRLEQTVDAKPTSYTDAKSGQVVYAYHAKLERLQADFAYLYGAMHDGAEPEFGTFRTSPRGRSPFTFTSFGDVKEQATWLAARNAAHSYGFAAFIIDPGSHRGGTTTIQVTYYDVVGPDGQLAPFETFTLRRPRRD